MTFDIAAILRSGFIGKTCRIVRREHDWDFGFGGDAGVAVSVPWRLVSHEGLALTRADDGQWYGLPEPVDAEACGNARLANAVVEDVEVDRVTADLRVMFSNGLRLDLFNDSCGYEGWQATTPGHSIIGMGGGDFSIFENRRGS